MQTMTCTGGANVPALNDLLAPFGIAFGDAILEGQVPLDPDKPYYASGANIVRFPAGGHLHGWQLADKATEGTNHCAVAAAAADADAAAFVCLVFAMGAVANVGHNAAYCCYKGCCCL